MAKISGSDINKMTPPNWWHVWHAIAAAVGPVATFVAGLSDLFPTPATKALAMGAGVVVTLAARADKAAAAVAALAGFGGPPQDPPADTRAAG